MGTKFQKTPTDLLEPALWLSVLQHYPLYVDLALANIGLALRGGPQGRRPAGLPAQLDRVFRSIAWRHGYGGNGLGWPFWIEQARAAQNEIKKHLAGADAA